MWSDMDPIWLGKQALQFYMAAIVSIISRRSLIIEEVCHINQDKSLYWFMWKDNTYKNSKVATKWFYYKQENGMVVHNQ